MLFQAVVIFLPILNFFKFPVKGERSIEITNSLQTAKHTTFKKHKVNNKQKMQNTPKKLAAFLSIDRFPSWLKFETHGNYKVQVSILYLLSYCSNTKYHSQYTKANKEIKHSHNYFAVYGALN